MKTTSTFLAALAFTAAPLMATATAFADDKATVASFYEYLSNPGSESHAATFKGNVSSDWQSVGDYSGKFKTADQLIGQLSGFAKLIPDMNWAIEEMLVADNRIIVRGRATGTPNGPLFGVDGKGKSFEIMSVDIHTLEGGKITKTYHVEDWAGALQQLSAN
ncbi:MAG: ester cyclase [Rhizobiaceae bacterium]|nr:ester cyclase [Rhizobiaceae bacterium]